MKEQEQCAVRLIRMIKVIKVTDVGLSLKQVVFWSCNKCNEGFFGECW